MTYPFSVDSMTRDLTAQMEKPLWPLSSYGPAKNEPNLLSGLDESFEELRVRAASALRSSNANEYMTYEAGKISAAEQVFTNARGSIQQAYEQATKQSPLNAVMSVFGKPVSAFSKPASTF
ncbi:hypothetical protein AX17_003100, partial [Amanita inopinata Kibby_2008]